MSLGRNALFFFIVEGCGVLPYGRTVVDTAGGFVPPEGADDPALAQVGTFNIDWLWRVPEAGYTPRNAVDYEMVGRLISDNGLDLMALEEIDGPEALALLDLPDEYAWVTGQTGWSQNVAILYRSDIFTIDNVHEIDLPANVGTSKSPLVAEVRHREGDLAFTFVGVHLNPYEDDEDAAYRQAQVVDLYRWITEDWAAGRKGPLRSQGVVIAGDFNDTVGGLNHLYPSLTTIDEDPDLYIATHDTDVSTQVSYQTQIDHVVLSHTLFDRYVDMGEDGACHVIAHDDISPWRDYDGGYGDRQNISSHRPVWIGLRTGL